MSKNPLKTRLPGVVIPLQISQPDGVLENVQVDLMRGLKDGDLVVLKSLHPSVMRKLESDLTAYKATEIVEISVDDSRDKKRFLTYQTIARDATRASAIATGLISAVILSGEIVTTAAIALLALLPGMVTGSKSLANSAAMRMHQRQATYVIALRQSIDARHRWVTSANRVCRILSRTFTNSKALYEKPEFGPRVRFMRRNILEASSFEIPSELASQNAIELRIGQSEKKLRRDVLDLQTNGFSYMTTIARYLLGSLACAALLNAIIFIANSQSRLAVASGIAFSSVLTIRWIIDTIATQNMSIHLNRELMRLNYFRLVVEIDNKVEEFLDSLLALYNSGVEVVIDQSKDLEPQLRRQLTSQVTIDLSNAADKKSSVSEI